MQFNVTLFSQDGQRTTVRNTADTFLDAVNPAYTRLVNATEGDEGEEFEYNGKITDLDGQEVAGGMGVPTDGPGTYLLWDDDHFNGCIGVLLVLPFTVV